MKNKIPFQMNSTSCKILASYEFLHNQGHDNVQNIRRDKRVQRKKKSCVFICQLLSSGRFRHTQCFFAKYLEIFLGRNLQSFLIEIVGWQLKLDIFIRYVSFSNLCWQSKNIAILLFLVHNTLRWH